MGVITGGEGYDGRRRNLTPLLKPSLMPLGLPNE